MYPYLYCMYLDSVLESTVPRIQDTTYCSRSPAYDYHLYVHPCTFTCPILNTQLFHPSLSDAYVRSDTVRLQTYSIPMPFCDAYIRTTKLECSCCTPYNTTLYIEMLLQERTCTYGVHIWVRILPFYIYMHDTTYNEHIRAFNLVTWANHSGAGQPATICQQRRQSKKPTGGAFIGIVVVLSSFPPRH